MWNSNNFNQPYSFNGYQNYMNNTRNYSSQGSYLQPQQQTQPQQSYQNNIIWVKDKENARSYAHDGQKKFYVLSIKKRGVAMLPLLFS